MRLLERHKRLGDTSIPVCATQQARTASNFDGGGNEMSKTISKYFFLPLLLF